MIKHKVVLPKKTRAYSPYQLEDCQRRLRYLKHDLQPIQFIKVDDNTLKFRIQRVQAHSLPSPMITFEVTGTLCRWGGTDTVLEDYQLKRLTARIDSWVIFL